MIHVCFSLYDKTGAFSKFTGTAMLSLFDNTTSDVTVHILHDNTITQDNREKFIYIAGRYGQLVKFYNVEKLCENEIKKINKLLAKAVKTRFSIAMFYRFFIADVLAPDINKIIYLDSDIVVNLDINELWKIELGENTLGVVTISSQKLNQPITNGFNSGVLSINIPAFRKEKETLNDAIKFFSESDKLGVDQEILNYCFAKRSLKLPVKFNRLVKWCRHYQETQTSNMIYHFNSHLSIKGLGFDTNDPFNRLWMSYYIQTPFFDANAMGRLNDFIIQQSGLWKTQTMEISAIVAGKQRAFFVEKDKIQIMKESFLIRDDELIIPAENESSIQKLLDAMKSSQGKVVFFIMTKKFLQKEFPIDLLIKKGFVLDKDFVRGWKFLTEKQGMPFNTNKLIQVM